MRKLTLKVEPIEVGNRQFNLHEHSSSRQQEYVTLCLLCMAAVASQDEACQDEAQLLEAFGAAVKQNFALCQFILADPIDGAGPVTEEWIAGLNRRILTQLVAWQDEIDDMEATWNRLHDLNQKAKQAT